MSDSIEEEKNQIVKKLSNYLLLPKAQRWICCEWFYSDIDKVIFESENDFSLCMKQSFPRLKTRKLRRKQWCILRGLIGKPRRCSDAFFQEERNMLEEKRQKIRLIQQRKVSEKDLIDYKDLPQEIPLTLSIGHRVYSHICHPEEGVFLGTIAAVDPCDHTYRVVFDRASLGSQTIYDHEIKSVTPVQTIPIRAYIQTYRPKVNSTTSQIMLNQSQLTQTPKSNIFVTPTSSQTPNINSSNPINLLIDDLNSINAMNNPAFAALLLQSNLDPMLGITSPFKFDSLNEITSQCPTPLINSGVITKATSGILGGFPIRILLMITRLNKILNIKHEIVAKLNTMNSRAEEMRARNEQPTKEFQTDYAILVLDLEKLNKDLSEYINGVQRFCEDLPSQHKNSTEESTITSHQNYNIKLKLSLESSNLVSKLNTIESDETKENLDNKMTNSLNIVTLSDTPIPSIKRIQSKRTIELISKLTTLFMQLRDCINSMNQPAEADVLHDNVACSTGMFLPHYTRLINESITEIKKSLSSERVCALFEDKVQVHINHIQSTLCHYNKLHAFKMDISQEDLNGQLAHSNQKSNGLQNNIPYNVANSVSSSNFQVEDEDEDEEELESQFEDNENMPDNVVANEENDFDDEDEGETDDSFNSTRKFAEGINTSPPNRTRLKKSITKSKCNKSKKLTDTKRLNHSSLNNFKTVLCSSASLQ